MPKQPEPYEIYRDVQVFLYQEVGGKREEWGALIKWQRRLVAIAVEDGEAPTFEQMRTAAHRLIDVMKNSSGRSIGGKEIS